ncbi:MAG TPA: globin [Propionicimonas sp.]|nr:globin [Propionicimonas sp.]HQA77003.1 globin [Propionicimonas sp.]HQD96160.1 globin [Propionicimonas sp.]
MPAEASLYDRVGGHETFVKLIDEFYRGVAADEPLRALYPEADLGPAKQRLLLFLEQYWGGPHTYSQTRGHPRLRLRHAPFQVTPDMRDRWLRHMNAALDLLELPQAELAEFREYVTRAAQFMINSFDN